MRFANRDHYIGKYVHDVRCGRGSQKYASGASYEGEWLDDMRHGQGTHTDENGVYHGGWAQDKEEGYGDWEGTNRPDDEAAYAGAWHLGLRCGMASSKYHDGATFEGEFRDDSRYHGRLDEPAGDVYEGYFQKHLRHGSGHQIYADGGDYQGAWQIGQRWGTGDYENPFERYSGEWERNERHGQGTWAGTRGDTEYAAKEVHYEGMWAEGLRCGACAARDQDGSAFEGEYWNDHRAKGVLKLANGDVRGPLRRERPPRPRRVHVRRRLAVHWGMARRQAGHGRGQVGRRLRDRGPGRDLQGPGHEEGVLLAVAGAQVPARGRAGRAVVPERHDDEPVVAVLSDDAHPVLGRPRGFQAPASEQLADEGTSKQATGPRQCTCVLSANGSCSAA